MPRKNLLRPAPPPAVLTKTEGRLMAALEETRLEIAALRADNAILAAALRKAVDSGMLNGALVRELRAVLADNRRGHEAIEALEWYRRCIPLSRYNGDVEPGVR